MEEKKLGEMDYEEAMAAIMEKMDYIENKEARNEALQTFLFLSLQL